MPPIPNILHKSKYRAVIHLAPPKGGIDRGRPVFKVTYEESSQVFYHLVLKAEFTSGRAGASQSGDFAYGMMREVARGTEARTLDAQESKWAWEHLRAQTDPGLSAYIANMAATVNQLTWLVMKCKDGLEDLDDTTKKRDVQKAIAMLTALKDPENQERLGAMLAVDLFTGNEDRFKSRSHETGIQNAGNIFFVDKGAGRYKLKGLDPWDCNKESAFIDSVVQSVAELQQEFIDQNSAPKMQKNLTTDKQAAYVNKHVWTGTLLSDNSQLKRIVQNALDSIAAELLPLVQGAGYSDKVIKEHFRPSSKDVDQVYKAVKKARDKIKGYCQVRANGHGGRVAPQGLRQRMQVLGWR